MPARNDLVERQAASIYKQGEQARSAGKARDAVAHFARVATVAPQSAVRATAQYDAAAALIGAEGLGRRGAHARRLPPALPEPPAAGRGERQARRGLPREGPVGAGRGRVRAPRRPRNKDPKVARDALWQAAELYEKASARAGGGEGLRALPRSSTREPLEPAVEARYRLARIAKDDGNAARELGADEGDLPGRPGRRRARAPTARATSAPRPRWRWPSRRSTPTARSRWSSRWRKQLKLKKAQDGGGAEGLCAWPPTTAWPT